MADMLKDLRFALRSLAGQPLLAAVLMLTFALGIGANAAVFSVVDAVLLRSLPYDDPGSLAMVWDARPDRDVDHSRLPPGRFAALTGPGSPFRQAEAFATARLGLEAGEEPLEVQAYRVTPGFFSLLGTAMVRGRGFAPDDERAEVVLLSERLWRTRFGADPGLVGRKVILDGRPWEVAGIVPAGLPPFEDAEVWIPLPRDAWRSRAARFLSVVVRLRNGLQAPEAQRELDALAQRLEREFPDTDAGWGLRLVPLREEIVAGVSAGLWVLWGAVTFVLLIACANAAAVLLSRGIARRRELAVRVAMGASRARLLRLFLAESVLLALAGGAFGFLLAEEGARVLVRWSPVALPRAGEIGADARVLAFTFATACLAGLISGLLPLTQALRLAPAEVLKDAGAQGGPGRGARRWFQRLVVAEIALTLVLLAGAGLMTKSFAHLLRVDLGLRAERILTFRLAPPRYRYPESATWARLYSDILGQLRQTPGVLEAGAVSQLPMSGAASEFRFLLAGAPPVSSAALPTAEYRVVAPGYFAALGIPLLEGAPPGDREVAVNRALARRYWPGQSPLGRRLSLDGPEGPWLTVSGVTGDVRHFGPGEEARPEIYRPVASDPWPSMTFVVRTEGDPLGIVASVRTAVRRADPALPIADLRSLEEVVGDSVARPRFVTAMLGALAGLALLLATVGLYGTLAWSVAQRAGEIGIRVSLGARRGDIARLILGQASRLALAGVGLGLGAAWLLTRLLVHLLFEVRPTDPQVLAGVGLLAFGVALGASALPALRACRIPPSVAFRGALGPGQGAGE